MASVSEQLLANLSWKAWTQATDLHKRILFTLGIFIVYRIGTYIPLPGIDPAELALLAEKHMTKGILGMFNVVSGGALQNMGIMMLNLMPYISSSIIIQLMTAIFPYFIALKKEGESGRRKLTQYTRYLTIVLASVQALGAARAMVAYPRLVIDPGISFYVSTCVTIVGATLFLMWLGEQITSRGVGNGSSMIIYAGIMAKLPQIIFEKLEVGRVGGLSSAAMMAVVGSIIALVVFVVFMERAYRKVIVQYPKRQFGRQVYSAEQTYMPIKLNMTGVLPPIFAMALLSFFQMLAKAPFVESIGWLRFAMQMVFEGWGFVIFQVFMIVFFAFFYTTIVFNPEETAENLRKNGGFVPGYRPGSMTAEFFVRLLNRLTVIGASYLAFVVIFPGLMNFLFHLDFPFQGTSLLIAVSVSMDIIVQVHSYLIAHQYGALMRKMGRGPGCGGAC